MRFCQQFLQSSSHNVAAITEIQLQSSSHNSPITPPPESTPPRKKAQDERHRPVRRGTPRPLSPHPSINRFASATISPPPSYSLRKTKYASSKSLLSPVFTTIIFFCAPLIIFPSPSVFHYIIFFDPRSLCRYFSPDRTPSKHRRQNFRMRKRSI